MPNTIISECKFCQVVSGALSAAVVFEDPHSICFLDYRPLFAGHCLLIPKQHYETLLELPSELLAEFFGNVQRISGAVQRAMQAEGAFVAINNRVSQSVPHLHVHIVPRRKGDGLKGFFWPRKQYRNGELAAVQQAIRAELEK
jgi:histidine triad (HIT) family protein